MAFTESNMLDLGVQAPNFTLPDTVSDKLMRFEDIAEGKKATVVMFLCNHCPYVIYVNEEIINISTEYQAKGVGFVGISSNDAVNYPQDGPKLMKIHAAETGYNFPYLYDELQEVAKTYDAACTPDFYIFDENKILIYRGRIDDARPKNDHPITGRDLRTALDAVLSGESVTEKQYPSGGCNIKWMK
jgi:thiol-disulfide isomerase/thioredoxin